MNNIWQAKMTALFVSNNFVNVYFQMTFSLFTMSETNKILDFRMGQHNYLTLIPRVFGKIGLF